MIFKPQGVCAEEMHVEIENGIITDLKVIKGCPGNALGISALIKGRSVDEVIATLSGIKCGNRETSCPDQLAQALRRY
ncbi:MAG: TIGR03905 family TSCPD domain-containing protein [Clostridiales bacterium]|nr:TIGR03905 family TSCPD domain-containing protein [Clostridiales bacterium]